MESIKLPQYTFLVKSQKYHGICLACLDEKHNWVRPVKNGPFQDENITMVDGKVVDLFDTVETKFGSPKPLKHHTENLEFLHDSKITFVKHLNDEEKLSLLRKITKSELLNDVESKNELHDRMNELKCSLILLGPVDSFDITNGKRPRIFVKVKNNLQIDLPCTDIKFSAFVKTKSQVFENNLLPFINSEDMPEFQGKEIYFVIGLTGDHYDEQGNYVDGKYTHNTSFEPKYWPMVVSVLSVPDYTKN